MSGCEFSFRCGNCETGVLVRGAKAGDGTEGTYFALAGSDAGSLFRITLDAQGRETGRQPLGALSDRTDEPVQRRLKSERLEQGWSLRKGRGTGGHV